MMMWVALLVAVLVLYLSRRVRKCMIKQDACRQKIAANQKVIKQRTEELEEHLKEDGVLVTAERERIVQLPVKELLRQLQDGQLKAVQVLHAFQAKAIEATRKTSCVAVFISEAEEWAKELDQSETRGPLHGLPLSMKECYDVEGYDSTLGLTKYMNKPASADAVIVAVLKKKGAVPFCKTNLPQTMICYDCSNPIYGTTVHPDNPSRSPGGSSGGEGALIAQHGSPLGLGSDLGGSLRIPSFCCGIATLKPTAERLSLDGSNSSKSLAGIQGPKWCVGCMGKEVSTVAAGMKALLDGDDMYKLDRVIPPLQWQEQLFSIDRKLRIGYYEEDGFFHPTPGCRRAVQEAVAALKQDGHELIPFRPPDIPDAIELVLQLIGADGWKSVSSDMLGNEIVDPALKPLYYETYVPSFVSFLLKPLMDRGLIPTFGGSCISSYSLWQAMARRNRYILQVISKWTEAKLDVCLSPGMPLPAQPLGYPPYNIPALSYNMLYNLLDFTVGMVPVTRETDDDQKKLEDYPTANNYCQKISKQATVGAVGMPIGVQVIGLPWQEELVLRGMLELETALRQHSKMSEQQ